MKCISVSQYLSNIDLNNYCTESDVFLVDFFGKPNNERTVEVKNVRVTHQLTLPEKLKTRTVEDVLESNFLSISEFNSMFNIVSW